MTGYVSSAPAPHYAGKATASATPIASSSEPPLQRGNAHNDLLTTTMALSIEQSAFFQQKKAKGDLVVIGTIASPYMAQSSSKSSRCPQV